LLNIDLDCCGKDCAGIVKTNLASREGMRKFKTPGSHAPVISGDNNKVVICDAAERAKLVALRREALDAMNPPKELKASNEAFSDSGGGDRAAERDELVRLR
jgi:hypothetical protein